MTANHFRHVTGTTTRITAIVLKNTRAVGGSLIAEILTCTALGESIPEKEHDGEDYTGTNGSDSFRKVTILVR